MLGTHVVCHERLFSPGAYMSALHYRNSVCQPRSLLTNKQYHHLPKLQDACLPFLRGQVQLWRELRLQ